MLCGVEYLQGWKLEQGTRVCLQVSLMILLTVVANFWHVLVEYNTGEDRLLELAHRLLMSDKLPEHDTRISYTVNECATRTPKWPLRGCAASNIAQSISTLYTNCRYKFHLLVESGLRYLCLAHEDLGHRIPFLLLQEVRDRFISRVRHC